MKIQVEFLRFVAASAASVPFNLAARVLFSMVMPFEIALIPAHLVGMTVAYLLNRRFVFVSTRPRRIDEIWRFAAVNLVSLLQTWAVSVGLLRLVFPAIGYGWNAEFSAHAIGIGSTAIVAFIGHKRISFRENPDRGGGA